MPWSPSGRTAQGEGGEISRRKRRPRDEGCGRRGEAEYLFGEEERIAFGGTHPIDNILELAVGMDVVRLVNDHQAKCHVLLIFIRHLITRAVEER